MVNPEWVVYIQAQASPVNGLGIENPVLNPLYQAEQYQAEQYQAEQCQAEHSNIVGDERRVSPLLPVEVGVNRSPHA